MNHRYALRQDQWERIKDMLPGREGHVGATARDNRLFVEAVLYRYRAGIPWRDLPERFGDFRVVHLRHSRWSKTDVWQRIFKTLSQDRDNEYVMIDSTIVRAHQHSAGAKKKRGRTPENQAIGRSRGGASTKIHATVDALGNPTGFLLTPGQAHDLQGADVLLKDIQADAILADKAYDAQDRVIEPLLKAGKTVVIPPRSKRNDQRDYDRHLYKARHLIENFFAKLKQYRCIATRYDKTARNFLGAVHLAASVVWLN
ncbi:IS5 family transposase [Verminephrobacter aporrectodeae subsp. tuberculatae]|uniref:IS5 family transposase n=1 Tax=Verminephrobacter aporrectodeae TaxID=1110389 RepID=UPI00223722CA|nr:IS5 family transposase [Verminephrobacter aporrectodeae]MCW5291203.1 IS5 family transposase [Verminephrobacter aporrectodeae subsp. tuberculatae]